MRYEASMSSLLQESSKALIHLTEVFQKVGYRTYIMDLEPGFRVRIRIGSGFNQVRESESGSGSRRAKMTHKSRKKFRNFMF
jgi:hypothetical protein